MTNKPSQLIRAMRCAVRITEIPVEASLRLHKEVLIDAKALAAEFQRLLAESNRRADHAREIGPLGGRPKSKHPTKAALAKRKSRAKQRTT